MTFYRRKLPHWQPDGVALFVTWRLHDSLPRRVLSDAKALDGKTFVAYDRLLDKVDYGPTWLKDDRIARLVVEAFENGHRGLNLYELKAFVVMINHVHVLLTPWMSLSTITRALKGYTSRQANQILGRTGKPFWQDESFDHWVRNEQELRRIQRYIEYNPVSAGLVNRIQDWPWSSATGRNE